MGNYSKSEEFSREIRQCLVIYEDMLGNQEKEKEETYGFVPGLQLAAEAKTLEEQRKKLDEGVFQVLFTGAFDAGKSTLLNALMRKNILRTAITAETAVITKIVFQQEEKVLIYEKETDRSTGQKLYRQMSIPRFFEEFRVSQENPEKFEKIDHVVLQQEEEGIAGRLVQLVDSPGTENSEADTMTARRFAEQASAIVHLINATQPFALEDKKYIAGHYANRNMKNLFFVINRIDSVNKDEIPELKKNVREQLKEVFTDKRGRFDEDLFESRVFYTNAYGSLMARTGRQIETPYGTVSVDDNVTGVPQFEDALSRFLTADDRDKEAFRGYMSQLANKYVSAMNKIESLLNDYRKGVDVLRTEMEEFEGKKEELEEIIDRIEEDCNTCVNNIINGARNEYDSCMNRIDSDWDSHFKQVNIPFKMRDMFSIAWNERSGNDEKVQEKTKPFAEAVQSYVKDEFEKMGRNLETILDGYLNTLQRQLEIEERKLEALQLPVSLNEIRQKLLTGVKGHGDITLEGDNFSNGNLFQIILGIIGMDPEIMLEGMRGKTSNGKALLNFLIKNVMEFIALYIVAWPIGIGMIIHRIYRMVKDGKAAQNSRAADILLGMKEETVKALQSEKERYIMELDGQVSGIIRAGKTMTEEIQGEVSDYSNSLGDTISKLENKQSDYDEEEKRTGRIRKELLESISRVNELLNGSVLTDDEVRELATVK